MKSSPSLPLARWVCAAARSIWQTGTVSNNSKRAVAPGQWEAGRTADRGLSMGGRLAEVESTGGRLLELAQRFGNQSFKICMVKKE